MSNKPTFAIVDGEKCLTSWLKRSHEGPLLVLDLHQKWTGPTIALTPAFEELGKDLGLEGCPDRLTFLQVEIPTHGEIVRKAFKDCPDLPSMHLASRSSCTPQFVVVRFGKVQGIVDGADIPALVRLIKEHVPPITKSDGGDDAEHEVR